jgi:hypothetical protein
MALGLIGPAGIEPGPGHFEKTGVLGDGEQEG